MITRLTWIVVKLHTSRKINRSRKSTDQIYLLSKMLINIASKIFYVARTTIFCIRKSLFQLRAWIISRINRLNEVKEMSRSRVFWYRLISLRKTTFICLIVKHISRKINTKLTVETKFANFLDLLMYTRQRHRLFLFLFLFFVFIIDFWLRLHRACWDFTDEISWDFIDTATSTRIDSCHV